MSGGESTRGIDATRRRVAIEMIAKHEPALRRTARRYSICTADADDAYQRALEILLVKAPPGDARELVRWMQTVTKHEALAIRRSRERQLGPPLPAGSAHEEAVDWLSLIPSQGAGPAERAERREDIARSREALRTLKPAELEALTLLAEGYSYAEIGELTGFSRTKVNRCLAEGRERFRAFLSRSETGARCADLRPALSAFCDGEASAEEAAALREHLRACGNCRAAVRAYRAAPGAIAVLLPAPVITSTLLGTARDAFASLLEMPRDAFAGVRRRIASGPGGALGEASAAQAGPSGGIGSAGLAKALAICAGTVGGAACVSTGIVPPPPGLPTDHAVTAHIERIAAPGGAAAGPDRAAGAAGGGLAAEPSGPEPSPRPAPSADLPARRQAPTEPEPSVEAPTVAAGEYVAPEPEPAVAPEPSPSPAPAAPAPTGGEASANGGNAAGEFGP